MPIAFVSYAKEDVLHARRLYGSLKENGIETWFDEQSLLPGQNWRHSIEAAISECIYFIALISSNSVSKKGYVQKELRIALDVLDRYPTGEVYIIPARVENCPIGDPKLGEIHYVDLFPDYEFGLSRLLKAIRETSGNASPPSIKVGHPRAEASQDQLNAARQFFEGIGAKREQILLRDSAKATQKARDSAKFHSLADEIEHQLANIVSAYSDAAGKPIVDLQVSEFPVNIFEYPGTYRILLAFGAQMYWLFRFVAYPDGTLALQLVRVQGAAAAKVSDNFSLTNNSINLVFQGEQFWISLNSAITEDVLTEVVRDIPRTHRTLELLPDAAISLARRAIEFELVRIGVEPNKR